ncbi:hypothetical protein Rs2_22760 [Raphanus sativus]|nr:hypothetical protein Rs2_22760 [Raphanus sativus]
MLASTQNPFSCFAEPLYPRSRSVLFHPLPTRFSITAHSKRCRNGGFSASAKRYHFGKELLSFASDNFLPLALVTDLQTQLLDVLPTNTLFQRSAQLMNIHCVFFLCLVEQEGLALHTEAIGAAVKGWPLGIFGLTYYFVAHSILIKASYASPTPTSTTCYRAKYILLYANHLIKRCWASLTYSTTLPMHPICQAFQVGYQDT